jgi:TRAP-type uncharacterized transport system substrate-binding protein
LSNGSPASNSAAERTALLAARHVFEGASRAVSRNRRQKFAFVILTLAIAIGGAFVARFYITPTRLVFAVGPEGTAENVFAQKLAKVVRYSRRIRIVVSPQDSALTAAQAFSQHKADIVIARTDTKLASRARAIAQIEHSMLLIGAPKGNKIKSLSSLKGKRLAIVGSDPRDAALVRQMLSFYDVPSTTPLEVRRAEEWPRLFEAGGPNAAFYIMRKSEIAADKIWPNHAQKPNFELVEVDGGKALESRLKGVTSETIEGGLLVASPKIPDDDVESIALDDNLVSHVRLSNENAAELASFVIENKEQLAEPGRYATDIQPSDTDKDAMVLAHPGAAEYVDGETKTFLERYSDLIYIGMSVASVVGTVFLGLYSTVTRVSPVRAGQLTDSVLMLGERATNASNMPELIAIEKELNEILSMVLAGLRDGSIAHEGFEAFRLVFDVAREAIATQKNIIAGRRDDVTTPAIA